MLAAQALVNSTWAQYLLDDAQAVQVTDTRKAEQLRAEAQRKIERALKFATDSLARVPDNLDGLVASADAQRLAGAPAKKKIRAADIDKLLKGAGSHAEVSYVRAMLRLREGDSPAPPRSSSPPSTPPSAPGTSTCARASAWRSSPSRRAVTTR